MACGVAAFRISPEAVLPYFRKCFGGLRNLGRRKAPRTLVTLPGDGNRTLHLDKRAVWGRGGSVACGWNGSAGWCRVFGVVAQCGDFRVAVLRVRMLVA